MHKARCRIMLLSKSDISYILHYEFCILHSALKNMYISIGSDMSVRDRSIIGIFDLENTTYSKHTKKFLARSEKNGEVVTVCEDIPKTFIVTAEYGMDRVYLCQFSAKALEKRIK